MGRCSRGKTERGASARFWGAIGKGLSGGSQALIESSSQNADENAGHAIFISSRSGECRRQRIGHGELGPAREPGLNIGWGLSFSRPRNYCCPKPSVQGMVLSPNRRSFAAGLGALAMTPKASHAFSAGLTFGPAQPFSFDLLKRRARALAGAPYVAPKVVEIETLQALDYDAYGQIVYRPEM